MKKKVKSIRKERRLKRILGKERERERWREKRTKKGEIRGENYLIYGGGVQVQTKLSYSLGY